MCSLPLHQVGPLIHGAVLLCPNFGFGPRLQDPAIMSFRTILGIWAGIRLTHPAGI